MSDLQNLEKRVSNNEGRISRLESDHGERISNLESRFSFADGGVRVLTKAFFLIVSIGGFIIVLIDAIAK